MISNSNLFNEELFTVKIFSWNESLIKVTYFHFFRKGYILTIKLNGLNTISRSRIWQPEFTIFLILILIRWISNYRSIIFYIIVLLAFKLLEILNFLRAYFNNSIFEIIFSSNNLLEVFHEFFSFIVADLEWKKSFTSFIKIIEVIIQAFLAWCDKLKEELLVIFVLDWFFI